MNIKFIKRLNTPLFEWTIDYRVHATRRMFERDIDEANILFLFKNGVIIEEYPEDYPFPSFLVNGTDQNGRALHAVVAVDSKSLRLYLITIYEPDPSKWADNFRRRIKQ